MEKPTYTFFHRDDECPNCGLRAFFDGYCSECKYSGSEKVDWD